MLNLEGDLKAFRGTVRITPVNPDFQPFEMTGDWLYKPIEGGYWYCNGRSFGAQICEVVRDDTIPTIDPVKHGRWEVDDPIEPVYSLRCSECGEEYEFDNGLFREQFYRFCPHCGTRMDGDGNDRKRI